MDETTPTLPGDATVDMENKENHVSDAAFVGEGTRRTGTRMGARRGFNLRKSLVWNNAFFTDEGILNPVELSVLSRSKSKCTRNNLSGIREEGLTPLASRHLANESLEKIEPQTFEDNLGLIRKTSSGSHNKEKLASRLLLEAESNSFETPMKQILNQVGCRSSSHSSAAYPKQKRLAHACPTISVSKIPKLRGNLAPPKVPNGQLLSRKVSHDLQNAMTPHAPRNESRKDSSINDKKANSAKSSVVHSDSISSLHPRPRMVSECYSTPGAVGHDKLSTSLLGASKGCENSPSKCPVKPSALRRPSPSIGFFVQGKSNSSHASNSQKHAYMRLNRNPYNERCFHPHLETPECKLVKSGSVLMRKMPRARATECIKKVNRKHLSGPSDNCFDSKSATAAVFDTNQSTEVTESADYEKPCCPMESRADYKMTCESVEDVNGKVKACGTSVAVRPNNILQKSQKSNESSGCESVEDINIKVNACDTSVAVKPNFFLQRLQKTNESFGSSAMHSSVDNIGHVENVDVRSELSDTCAKIVSTGLLEECAKLKSVPGVHGSFSYGSSNGAYFSLVDNQTGMGIKLETDDGLIAAGRDITIDQSEDRANSFLTGNNEFTACQVQCPKPKMRSPKTSGHEASEQSYSSPSNGYSNFTSTTTNMMENSISGTREGPLEEKDRATNISKEVIVKLQSRLKAEPFSEEWIAAVESFGEDILEMKTGVVQNSPTEKILPKPSPWSPVKKNQDLGPNDCTKYTNSKITMPF